jgi:hypothetical protein
MWYFIVGAILGVISLIARNPVEFGQAEHKFQGALVAGILGAATYGTIFWLISRLF